MKNNTFYSTETAWCPGCGNFAILETLVSVLNSLKKEPREILLVGGIGQAAKLNQYVNANGFSGLHGRALPAAVAAKIANESLTVIVNTGDGDSYGEGGNHFLHNIRRNADITHFVHNNQIYGLTKGQPSPTSAACSDLPSAACNINSPLNPLLLALAAGATFVARSFSGNEAHLARIMKAAVAHKGYALVDILQPCISFNKVNTFAYYNERVYELEKDYKPSNREKAMQRCTEWGKKIPIGIFYQAKAPTFHERRPEIFNGTPLVDQAAKAGELPKLLKTFL
ncbi:thiamine pyrophosphate-dependent enzyme [Breznakiella homolactica]|uniref:2-oxoacid ferredoxin oxidoreductase n=1 Tax=Breznakiella homolactica TaxID=2798577 RepID=A0A7T8BAL0_9SPIR|nr:thiamine pyrophosphate-dependent enzyme [Breznakiella homolactica]QQO09471.1 2-oxoacid ferredoxin oxidoreductase [Breznakiella homolactica]